MSSLLFADFTMIYEMGGGAEGTREEVIQYRDPDTIKMSFHRKGEKHPDLTGEYILQGTRYTVLEEEGKLTYMNVDKVDKALTKLTDEMNISSVERGEKVKQKPFFTLKRKLGKKEVAGIEGEVWEVESKEDGRTYTEQIVVTNDRGIVRAMKIAIEALKSFGEGPYGMEIDHDLETMMLPAEDYALISAEGMKFKSYHTRKIDDSVFQLPKEAVNSMKGLPKMDKKKEEAGKRLLKTLLE